MNFFLKALVKKQLKGVPDDQIEMILKIVENNPQLFKKIAEEIQAEIESGADQQEATMRIMKAHESELKGIVGK